MLEALWPVLGALFLLGVGAAAVYWPLAEKLKRVDDQLKATEAALEIETENFSALEDAHKEILAPLEVADAARNLSPSERIGMLIAFDRARRRAAGRLSGASALEGEQGPLGLAGREGRRGSEGGRHPAVSRPDPDLGEPEQVDRAG